MSLRAFQQALAELVTSDAMCVAVVEDAAGALVRYDLTERECRRLAFMAAQRGMRLNHLLHRANRAAPVFSLLPLTCFLLDRQLRPELEQFWATVRGDARFDVEVLAFGDFVAGRLASGELAVAGLQDALVFEMSSLRLQLLDADTGVSRGPLSGIRVVRFRHDPLPLLERLAERQPPAQDTATGEFWLLLDARGEPWDIRVVDPLVGRLIEGMQNAPAIEPSSGDLQMLAAAGIEVGTQDQVIRFPAGPRMTRGV